jgi:hypothetical protein
VFRALFARHQEVLYSSQPTQYAHKIIQTAVYKIPPDGEQISAWNVPKTGPHLQWITKTVLGYQKTNGINPRSAIRQHVQANHNKLKANSASCCADNVMCSSHIDTSLESHNRNYAVAFAALLKQLFPLLHHCQTIGLQTVGSVIWNQFPTFMLCSHPTLDFLGWPLWPYHRWPPF